MLAREDLRHLLKHSFTVPPSHGARTAHDRAAGTSQPHLDGDGKPLYRFVTRRLFGWADREERGDRRL